MAGLKNKEAVVYIKRGVKVERFSFGGGGLA